MTRNIERRLEVLTADLKPAGECGVDVMGQSHDPSEGCLNEDYDQYTNEPYCRAQNARMLEHLKDDKGWLPYMLDTFWQNGIGTEGAEFLRKNDFLVSYE